MSQSGNHFLRKPTAKTIRVVVPVKPQPAPEKPPVVPETRPAAEAQVIPTGPRAVADKTRAMPEQPRVGSPPGPRHADPKLTTYSKIFRWRLPDGQTKEPATVEIVGSFTHWQKVPLTRDGALDSWHAALHNIQGYKTHHYMLLVDGKPAHDKHADGIAPPNGPQEERYQLMTPRGPRVFMLFAQAK